MDIHSIVKKCVLEYGIWGGYLQPVEILKLIDSGLIDVQKHRWDIKYAKEKKKKGECNPTWFYFVPKPQFIELHRGLKRKNKIRK